MGALTGRTHWALSIGRSPLDALHCTLSIGHHCLPVGCTQYALASARCLHKRSGADLRVVCTGHSRKLFSHSTLRRRSAQRHRWVAIGIIRNHIPVLNSIAQPLSLSLSSVRKCALSCSPLLVIGFRTRRRAAPPAMVH